MNDGGRCAPITHLELRHFNTVNSFKYSVIGTNERRYSSTTSPRQNTVQTCVLRFQNRPIKPESTTNTLMTNTLMTNPTRASLNSFTSPQPSFSPRFKGSTTAIQNLDPYVIHENGTLEIHTAQPLNSGRYTCIATNALGIKENHVQLEVKGQPDDRRNSHTLKPPQLPGRALYTAGMLGVMVLLGVL